MPDHDAADKSSLPDSKGFRGAGRGSGPIPKSAGSAALSSGSPLPTPSTPVAAAQETPAVVRSKAMLKGEVVDAALS